MTRGATQSRSASDTATPSDAASRAVISFGRFAFDVVTAADLAARAETQARTALDIATPNDTVGVFHTRELDLAVTAVPDRFALAGVPDRFALAATPDRFHLDALERTP